MKRRLVVVVFGLTVPGVFAPIAVAHAQCVTDSTSSSSLQTFSYSGSCTAGFSVSGSPPNSSSANNGSNLSVTSSATFGVNTGEPAFNIQSVGSQPLQDGDTNGGLGGAITYSGSGAITINGIATNILPMGAITILSQGGKGSSSKGDGSAGDGGNGGTVTVTLGNSISITGVTTTGATPSKYAFAGLFAASVGGEGGGGVNGRGGEGGAVTVTLGQYAQTGAIETAGTRTPAVVALSMGGAGHEDAGGDSGSATINLASGSTWTLTTTGSESPGLWAISDGGNADGSKTYSNGGNSGTATINTANATLNATTSGNKAPALYALSEGGEGSDDPGGAAGAALVQQNGTITTNGTMSPGVLAESQGGGVVAGSSGDTGGSAGSAGASLVSGSITTNGVESPALAALSLGGQGGTTTDAGGAAGAASVTANAGTSIATTSDYSPGILAASLGGGGTSFDGSTGSQASKSYPGASGTVTVTNAAPITTQGTGAAGIMADSVTGGGGLVQWSSGNGVNFGDISAAAADPDSVTVTNSAPITTQGADAPAILAQSIGGGGGLLALASSAATATIGGNASGDSSADRTGNGVGVTNSANLTTNGLGAIGILAQSIGGGGGTALVNGGTAVLNTLGGTGSAGGAGGAVTVSLNQGMITTSGDNASGVLAQSIGGGGGNGRNKTGVFAAVGGQGGAGGNGGAVSVTNSAQGGGIATSGDFAHGVIAQSIGGGGGNGGAAKSAGPFASAAIGGAGGKGGAGGTVAVTNWDSAISTTGDAAHGMLAQSVGGGGGNGGAANAHSVGVLFSASMTLGGSGGSGGNGGPNSTSTTPPTVSVNATNAGVITTSGHDSVGILAQSVGGGGGNGGSALSKSLATMSEDPTLPTISFSASLGGSGGSGGAGEMVTVTNEQGTIETSGNGAIGILAQSIGGGGGNGGDSTAAASSLLGDAPNFKIALAFGGSGGSGQDGGAVAVTNQPNTAVGTSAGTGTGLIQTTGNNATGIIAQSIGGGGGNGGAGNASVTSQNIGGTPGIALGLSFAMGGSGGSGGSGNTVTVSNLSSRSKSAVISTSGSGSQGILAQSIGGGGGNGGGGAASGSGDTVNTNIAVGASGGDGGTGGAVTVTNSGQITTGGSVTNYVAKNYNPANLENEILTPVYETVGGDAVGILAQSIGGGGGVAGSSDPVSTVPPLAQIENIINTPATSYSANIGVGGTGGGGGAGGAVTVTNSGSVATLGERAYGVQEQSIGGGGGSGGAAVAASGAAIGASTYSGSVTVGGQGGVAGDGGAVSATNSGTLSTAGYAATGLIAQSIGGGGGIGAEGSENNNTTIGLGLSYSGKGGAGGSGGSTTVTNSGAITTLGDDAYGIIAQSIGGGGGLASAGCSNSNAQSIAGTSASRCLGNTNVGGSTTTNQWNDNSSYAISAGGGAGASGNGSAVQVTENGSVTTTGARAIGIVAQSIGGGGGIMTASAQNIQTTSIQPNPGQNDATGGDVTVTLGASGSVTTSGAGAWGILAQSIGGGGGLAGDPSLALVTPTSNTLSAISNDHNPDAGTISITTAGTIATSGANAHGIVAQAVGGGGGIAAGWANSTDENVVMGNSAQLDGYTNMKYSGQGGAITIDQTGGSIITSGPGSIGILAQSSGNAQDLSPIAVTVGGTVIGGSGASAAGIMLSGGEQQTSTNVSTSNTITVNAGGSVSTMGGINGTAITTTDGYTNVSNAGTITGNIILGATPGTVTNTGVLNAGPTISASVVNNGRLNVGNAGSAAPLAANYTAPLNATAYAATVSQISEYLEGDGTIAVGVDMVHGVSDQLFAARYDGTNQLQVNPVTLLPNTPLPVLSGIAISPSSVPTLIQPLGFTYDLTNAMPFYDGGNYINMQPAYLNVAAHLTTPTGVSLTTTEKGSAQNLQNVWDSVATTTPAAAGWSPAVQEQLGTVFAGLATASASQYTTALNSYAPQIDNATASDTLNSAQGLASATQSCPAFEGDGALLAENGCVWERTTGRFTSQNDNANGMGYSGQGVTFMLGGQKELAPGWFLGGVAAYNTNWFESSDKLENRNAQTGSVAVTIKRQIGQWLFSGSLVGGGGGASSSRLIDFPYLPVSTASSTNSIGYGLGRLRGAYEFTMGPWYVKPEIDLDGTYIQQGGYTESGAGVLNLQVGAAGKGIFAFSPQIEIGRRVDLPDGLTLRPHAAIGMAILSTDSWNTPVRLASVPGLGYTDVTSPLPNRLGSLLVGADLHQKNGWEAKVEYGTNIGGSFTSQTATLRLAYRF